MKKKVFIVLVALMPFSLQAQGGGSGGGLQLVLDQLYREMMPLCKGLISASRLIGGFGALWFIGARVWQRLAAAEPLDVYGLLRPFVLGGCIAIFPLVIDLINGVLAPTVAATSSMVAHSDAAMDKWLQQASTDGFGALNPANWFRSALQGVLEFLFQAVALVISTIRTFYLIVLAIIGPLVFGISIYDGFQHLLTVWLARYINVFLWLPVANIFGAIIARVQEQLMTGSALVVPIPGQPVTVTDFGYLAFLLIAIVGYCTVPSVANYIVNAGGGNTLLYKVSSFASTAVSRSSSTVVSGMSADAYGDGARMTGNMSDAGINNDYFKDKLKGG
jgi:hypothetical protein